MMMVPASSASEGLVDRDGWTEADAAVVELGLQFTESGVGLAVRERRSVITAIYHGVSTPLALAGEEMALTALWLRELGL